MTKLFRMAGSFVLAAAFAAGMACGSNDGDSDGASPGGEGGGDGDGAAWEGEFETGTEVALELWVDPSDPDLAEFEAFREATGAAPVLYGRVTVTNDAYVEDTARFVTLTGPGGDPFAPTSTEVQFLCSHIARWIAAVTTQTTELNNQYAELLEGRCNGNTIAGPVIPPGETITYYVAYEGDTEPEFERVFMGLGNELKR